MTTEAQQFEFRIRLQEEFSRRCRSNERYSLRAFARHAGVDASTLSQILAGKRRVSEKMFGRILEQLGLDSEARGSMGSEEKNYFLIQQDVFSAISDWYHFAILDLSLLPSFKSEPAWIARKLGISLFEAKTAIARLIRLEMLQESKGRLMKTQARFSNYREGITSAAHKEYQRQVIRKALAAIDNCPAELKDITSMTIAASAEKLPAAKEKIKKFRRQLCAFLEDGKKDSVYHLAVQLYPVTEIDS